MIDWNSAPVKQSLVGLREMLFLQGRDSRVVRYAMAYSSVKKQWLEKIKQSVRGVFKKRPKSPDALHFFFWLPGGLGDAACARRVVSRYLQLLPDAQVEIYSPVPGAVKTVFADFPQVVPVNTEKQYWHNFDLVVFVCLGVKFLYAHERRLAQLAPNFLPVYQQAVLAQNSLGALWKDPFLTEPALGRWLLRQGGKRLDLLAFTSGLNLDQQPETVWSAVPEKLVKWDLVPHQYITFHDGAVGDTLPTRMWPRKNWEELLLQIKKSYPQLKIVQIGTEENFSYPQADVCLCGKTATTELPALLASSALHVDTESGLVHLAQYLPTKSIVLFGPSDKEFFSYKKNINLSSGNCGGCMWMTSHWMQQCPLSAGGAACMQAISTDQVYQAVREFLQ